MADAERASSVEVVPEWTLGWRLKRALAFARMNVEQMAEEVGVERATISRWMNDRGGPPRPIYVRHWALRTGVSFEWLATGRAAGVAEGDCGELATTESRYPINWGCPAKARTRVGPGRVGAVGHGSNGRQVAA